MATSYPGLGNGSRLENSPEVEGSQPTKAASVTKKDLTVEPSERGGGGTLQKCGMALEKEQRVAK